MRRSASPPSQVDQLLADTGFAKVVAQLASEIERAWTTPLGHARGLVVSALGDPAECAKVYSAWISGERALARVILRRRVLDLLESDARRPGHQSLTTTTDELELDVELQSGEDLSHWSVAVEHRLFVHTVLEALDCFAGLGLRQHRQAVLLRYVIDGGSYAQLRAELGVTSGALRVRVHKALRAFRAHFESSHPERF